MLDTTVIYFILLLREGKTALDIAREENYDRIVAMILEMEFKESQTKKHWHAWAKYLLYVCYHHSAGRAK